MYCREVKFLKQNTFLPENLNFYCWDLENSVIDFRINKNHENVTFLKILPLLNCHKINTSTNFKNPYYGINVRILRQKCVYFQKVVLG